MTEGIEGVPPVKPVFEILKDRRGRPDIPKRKPTPKPQDNLDDQPPVEPNLGRIVDERA